MPKRANTETETARRVGRRLATLRSAQGWTQARLAEAIGLPPSSISRVENGQRSLSVDQLLRAARVLGVSPSEIFGGKTSARSAAPSEESAIVAAVTRLDPRQRRLVLALIHELAGLSKGGDDSDA